MWFLYKCFSASLSRGWTLLLCVLLLDYIAQLVPCAKGVTLREETKYRRAELALSDSTVEQARARGLQQRNYVATHNRVEKREAGRGYLRPCYYTNWSQYRQGHGKFLPENYIPGLCTHILFAFGWMNEDFTVRAFDPADESTTWSKGMFARVNELKNLDRGLKTLLSIGGWTFGTRLFKAMSETSKTRQTFIDSAIVFLRQRHFDGLDIDWEYPQGEEDKTNYVALIKELRQAFDEEAAKSKQQRLLLTGAVSAADNTIKDAYDIPTLARYFDFVLLMAYDFHGAWETTTGVNAPLYAMPTDPEWLQYWNMDWAANHWAESGMPKEKIVVGVAAYGRGWTLKEPTKDRGPGAKTTGPSKATHFVQEAGVAAFYEFCEMLATGATRIWQEESRTPYLIHNDQWYTYDDVDSVRAKMHWLKSNGYGGAFIWTLDFDDFGGRCQNGSGVKFPLLRLIKEELVAEAITTTTVLTVAPTLASTTPPQTPPPPTTTTTVSYVLSTTTATPASGCPSQSSGFRANPDDCNTFLLCLGAVKYVLSCPANLQFSAAAGHCVEAKQTGCRQRIATTSTSSQSTTPETTTAEAPFKCQSDGFSKNVHDCSAFYRCVGGVAYHFSCPLGLYFNPETLACDRAETVNCVVD